MATTPRDREPWWRSPLTDYDENIDGGAVWVALSVFAMIALSAWDVLHNGRKFEASELGMGVGALLGGWAAYKWGDSRSRPGGSVQVRSTTSTKVDIPDDR